MDVQYLQPSRYRRPGPINLIDIDALIGEAHLFAPMPPATVRLASLLAGHQYDVEQIADIISYDPVLTMRLIRTANSAYQASSVPVTSVKAALVRVGAAQALALAVAGHARPLLVRPVPEYGLDEGELWSHSVASAVVAETLPVLSEITIPPESFTAALIHDIGKLVMARFLDPEVLNLVKRAQIEGGLNTLDAEIQVLAVHHGEVGGIVAQHWNMPDRIVQAIIHHHHPGENDDLVCWVTYLSNEVAKVVESRLVGRKHELSLDPRALSRIGIATERLEQLFGECSERFSAVRDRYNSR